MRRLAVFILFALSVRVFGASYTNTAATQTDFANTLALASDGDSVYLIAGDYTFSSKVSYSKAITIAPVTNGVVFIDEIPNATRQNGDGTATLFFWQPTSNVLARLTGIKWQGGTVNTANAFDGALRIGGTSRTIRIDHCVFTNLHDLNIAWKGPNAGCVDHNTNWVNFNNWCEVSQGDLGENAWASAPDWGTTNAVYLEYNQIRYNGNYSGANVAAVNDLYSGGKVVVRYNAIYGPFIQNHGTETGQDERSGRTLEAYGNYMDGPGANQAFYWRGGSARVWGNTVTNWGTLFGFFCFRQTDPLSPWKYANGTNTWDTNVVGLVASGTHTGTSGLLYLEDSAQTWTPNQFINGYEVINLSHGRTNQSGTLQAGVGASAIGSNYIHQVYCVAGNSGSILVWTNGDQYEIYQIHAVLDQPGYGQGDLINDNSGAPYNTVLGGQAYPRQTLEGIYQWNNTFGATANYALGDNTNYTWNGTSPPSGPYTTVRLGVHYFNSSAPSYTALGQHPLDPDGGGGGSIGVNWTRGIGSMGIGTR